MKKITKAIIPVAGWGTRRLPITKIIEKSMLPVGNRPLVDYSVQELIAAGVKDIYMVISNVEPCQVQEFYRDNLALNQYLLERGKADRLNSLRLCLMVLISTIPSKTLLVAMVLLCRSLWQSKNIISTSQFFVSWATISSGIQMANLLQLLS